MAGKGEDLSPPLTFQTTVPSCPGAPKFNVEPPLTLKSDAFTVSVVPCAAAVVEFPDNKSTFVRVSLAVASSSPPVCVKVPVPNAPPLPTASSAPGARVTLPIVFALLSDAKPASTWSAPAIVSEPEFSRSVARSPFTAKEFAKSAPLIVTVYGPMKFMTTASPGPGTVLLDQFVATLQSPLKG